MSNSKARSFTDLIVWQKAHAFVLQAYRLTQSFPKSEIYGLTSQLRRSAVSIPANIAEGFRRPSKREKCRFLDISHSSLEESRYYLILANDLNFAETHVMQNQLDEISKLLNAYKNAIKTNQ